jgi:DNA-directed RNA polymerase subunit RPC12/RpoP
MTEDTTTIICVRADSMLLVAAVKGTITSYKCSRCRRRVMVAPSSQRVIRSDRATVLLCLECAAGQAG